MPKVLTAMPEDRSVYIFPRVVPDHGALAALDGQREPRISSGYVFLVLLL